MNQDCPFCPKQHRYILEHGTAAALFDSFPVNPGHILVVPKAHRRDLFDCTPEEIQDIWTVVEMARELLEHQYHPDGYNVGANVGAQAGQTIFHCHIHVIPRYIGDVDNPRGGVRRVKPAIKPY